MTFTVDTNASVTSWKSNGGKDILFPAQEINRKLRGFSHVCFPFGPADDDFLEGTPQHGHLRDGVGRHHETQVSQKDGSIHTSFVNPGWVPGTELDCSIKEKNYMGFQSLSHKMWLSHNSTRTNGIPVSLGIHWYFATCGQNFSITDANEQVINWDFFDRNSESRFCAAQIGGRPRALLETHHGVVTIDAITGFDELVFWTDNPGQYICVEPVIGRLKKNRIYIGSGASHHTECHLTYGPTS